jgi:hypothetical protein
MQLGDGKLRLSNGKGNDPLVLEWPWDLPQTVVIHWTGTQYEAIATYKQEKSTSPQAFALGEAVIAAWPLAPRHHPSDSGGADHNAKTEEPGQPSRHNDNDSILKLQKKKGDNPSRW